ncbi:quinone-dependent dihydroorotate dehydrogenase [uncultured Alistipes sp.]|uniref:quinone-dependent dihydroorotate dehydrogenase n=1 Tax=uncultured Alistipes sp. TaxID=538949 RepID=UPI002627F481|nr:quinone-dependent dihydroorotate dehydrogenase [uncultured Alistipes sp.]
MYQRVIKPILFSLSIERAHRVVILLLRIIGMIPGGRWLLHKCYGVEHPALEREVFGIRFRNPVGLAAGFDSNGEIIRECSALGFGFVEVGTVTPRPQAGNPRPRIFRLPKDRAIIHRIGLANRGLERMIQHLRRPHKGVIVGCNIGKNTATPPESAPADYLKLFRNLYQYADYFTVNISCDNACRDGASHSREYILQILDPLFDFRRGQNQYRPVMLKVSPDMTDETIDLISDILLTTPLDGIVATNGSLRRDGLQTSRESLDKIGNGRIGGAPLAARAVEIVRRIHTRSGGNFPIIGVGGLMSADDVRAMLDAGADLVQLYTGYVYEGPALVGNICRALVADAEKAAAEKAAAEKAAAEKVAAEKAEAEAAAEKVAAEKAEAEAAAQSQTEAQAAQEPASDSAPKSPQA